uniref:Glycosyl transferase n=1 Tax=Eubacterium cellulosolvens (strain ATCC 43171 / JCM 9499 / 6) TaxID=633697 RepID=I5AQ94_EUBC6
MKTNMKCSGKYDETTVSVIIPVYNTQEYLSCCLDSVVNQSYRNLQIILVDDGSTDNSLEICEQYARQDERITVIHKVNGGVSSARNVGLKSALGGYLTFIDSDDWIEPVFVESLVHDMEENNSDCSMCEMIEFDEHQEVCIEVTFEKLGILSGVEASERLCVATSRPAPRPIFYAAAKLFRRQLRENILWDEGLHKGEDQWVLFQIFREVETLSVLHKKGYHYRINRAGSLSNQKDMECDYEVAYRMYSEARRMHRNLDPYIENVVVHSLGKMRRECLAKNYDKYNVTRHDFRTFYPIAKNRIKKSTLIIKLSSIAVLYFPRMVYRIVSLYLHIQGR